MKKSNYTVNGASQKLDYIEGDAGHLCMQDVYYNGCKLKIQLNYGAFNSTKC